MQNSKILFFKKHRPYESNNLFFFADQLTLFFGGFFVFFFLLSWFRLIRIFCRTDYIDFYDKYFFKHEALRKDLENNYITLYSKKDINLQSVDSSLHTDCHWIQL